MLKRGLHCFPRIVVFFFSIVYQAGDCQTLSSWRLSILCIGLIIKSTCFFRVSTEKNIGTLFMWLIATTPDDFKAENVDL